MSDGRPKDKVIASNATPASGDKPREFSDRDLPLLLEVSDTTVLGEGEQSKALNAIASRNETVALQLGEDLPNLNANPEKTHVSDKKEPDFGDKKYLKDAKTLDFLAHLINMPKREKLYVNLRPVAEAPLGKQCPGGNGGSSSKGSQTETSSSQGSFVTGYTGTSRLSNNMVTGLGRSGGGGGNGDDDDPFHYRHVSTLSGHYAEFTGFEEQLVNGNSDHRDVSMAILNPMAASPMLPQFNRNQEEARSYDLEGLEVTTMEGIQVDEFDFDIASSILDDISDEISLPGIPTEETSAASCIPSRFPVLEETRSDIKDSFDMIKLMKPRSTQQRPHQPTVGITPFANTIPHSQIPGLTATQCPPSPMSSIAPSPLPPLTPLSATPSSPMVPPTPKPQGQGLLKLNTFTEEDKRVCELSVPRDIPPEKGQAALRALFFISVMYPRLFECSEQGCDLKVANDVQAKMCEYDFHLVYDEGKVQFAMPKDCELNCKYMYCVGGPVSRMSC